MGRARAPPSRLLLAPPSAAALHRASVGTVGGFLSGQETTPQGTYPLSILKIPALSPFLAFLIQGSRVVNVCGHDTATVICMGSYFTELPTELLTGEMTG